MSLLDPTPGEIADRLGILFRKIVEAEWAHKPKGHWEDEYHALWDHLKSNAGPLGALDHSAFWIALMKLAAVNAAIWDAEERVHSWISTRADYSDMTSIYLKITQLNTKRSNLIHEIDLIFDPQAPQEKLHD